MEDGRSGRNDERRRPLDMLGVTPGEIRRGLNHNDAEVAEADRLAYKVRGYNSGAGERQKRTQVPGG
jgi:hypothetical protein